MTVAHWARRELLAAVGAVGPAGAAPAHGGGERPPETKPIRMPRYLVAQPAQALREIPYQRWREYDSADSLRFYALRLHEAGLIKSNPQKLLAQGTNWRFIEQLKKELKT